jgi:hypothetical protein
MVEPEPCSPRSLVMKTTLVIVILLALLGTTIGWAIWGWEQTAGTAMGFHGWLAMILGIVFTLLVGCGLMALMFYSSRQGYDEAASDLGDRDEPRGG